MGEDMTFDTSRFRKGASILLLLWLCLLCGATTHVQAQTLEQKLDDYLKAAQRVQHFQGAALVAQDGKILFSKGYGMADAESFTRNFDYTKFQVGSVTKQFTAAAIMQLVEKGKLKLDAPISAYLPDYPQPTADKVTIHHLLTHTSGIPNYTALPEALTKRNESIEVKKLLELFDMLPLEFEPGAEMRYSNSGYEVLGAIIEQVTGRPYAAYVRDYILKPAGMASSDVPGDLRREPGMAIGYAVDSLENTVAIPYVPSSFSYAAGALVSTVQDMYRWDQALRGTKILSRESLDKTFTPFKNKYGYGWVIDTLYAHQMVTHDGAIDGFGASFIRFTDQPFCVVVLCNNASAPVSAISLGLTAIANGQPYDVPVRKTAISLQPSELDQYVGAYEIGAEQYRLVMRDGDNLFARRTGGASSRLVPEAKDKFFYEHDNTITLTFVRDAGGRIVSHVIHQRGADATAQRVEDTKAGELLAGQTEASVDPAVYDQLAGQYELAPGFVLTVRRDGNRIVTQATGQQEVEIYPKSEMEYFLKVVDAQISFVKDQAGAVSSLVLHQGGRDMPAKKIK
jgi:D-alanyl-D-alanine carboxypeptidase